MKGGELEMADIFGFMDVFSEGDIICTTLIMDKMKVSRPTAISILNKAFLADLIISCSEPKDPVKYYLVI